MKELKITIGAISSALILWTVGIGLSQYLADEPLRAMKDKAHASGNTEGAPNKTATRGSLTSDEAQSLSQLEAAHLKNPELEEPAVRLANALFEKGIGEGDAESLKKAVGLYHEILEKFPEQADALLGLGTLSLHVGVSDKAIEYYERYLAKNPGDDSVRANLGLAFGRNGEHDRALNELNDILSRNPEFVIGLVTKGLILAETGKKAEALSLWKKAKDIEKNPSLKDRIETLISGSSGSTATEPSSNEKPDASNHSQTLRFFTTNEITAPKYAASRLSDNGILEVRLKDFPVQAMPPFAREKFERSIKEKMALDGLKQVQIFDAASNESIMTVTR